jgi:hypothetical protein
MKLTLAIPFFNQLNDAKGPMGLLKHVTSADVEWLIIDNGSHEPIEDFFRYTLRPKRMNFIHNKQNLGMIATYQQIFDNTQTDLVAVLHNDVFVYEPNWDHRVVNMFETIDKLGTLGFFGAQGVGPNGERIQHTARPEQMAGISNMLEAETHGIRMTQDYLPAAILDGFAMVFNLQFIKEAGGIDKRYHYHHFYDRDLPLTALNLGYKNIVLNVPCHHVSGATANRPEYQEWVNQKLKKDQAGDTWTHDENMHLFKEKWDQVLPLYLNQDFSFLTGTRPPWNFKGNAILSYQPKEIQITR